MLVVVFVNGQICEHQEIVYVCVCVCMCAGHPLLCGREDVCSRRLSCHHVVVV